MRKIKRDPKIEQMIKDKYNEYSLKYRGRYIDFPYKFFEYDDTGRLYLEYDENEE